MCKIKKPSLKNSIYSEYKKAYQKFMLKKERKEEDTFNQTQGINRLDMNQNFTLAQSK